FGRIVRSLKDRGFLRKANGRLAVEPIGLEVVNRIGEPNRALEVRISNGSGRFGLFKNLFLLFFLSLVVLGPTYVALRVGISRFLGVVWEGLSGGFERTELWVTLLAGLGGSGYALMLAGQVLGADQGTRRMREFAAAIREGANAYFLRQ